MNKVSLSGVRYCSACGMPIDGCRPDQFQHDGECYTREVRRFAKVLGVAEMSRIEGRDVSALCGRESPWRSRGGKSCLNATRAGEAIDTGEGE